MVKDGIPEPKGLTQLLDARFKAEKKMPLDKFTELVKAGKDEENRDAVAVLRATRALKARVTTDLRSASVTASLDTKLRHLSTLLDRPLENERGRALLYAVLNSRNVRDANVLTSTEWWGGPFTQIFGQGDRKTGRNMWASFLEKNPNFRAEIVGQLIREFPEDRDYVEESVSNPSHGRYMMQPEDAHQRRIWNRFLELTLDRLRTALR